MLPIVMVTCSACGVTTLTDERCKFLDEQQSYIVNNEKGRAIFDKHGFFYVVGESLPPQYPPVLISKTVIRDCTNRWVAEKYFANKISGKKDLPVTAQELAKARRDIAFAVPKAIKASPAWPDGVGHEIMNIVDDALLPDYWDAIIDTINETGHIVYPTYFTKSMFEHPKGELKKHLDRILEKKDNLHTYDVALILFIEKNMGYSINAQNAIDKFKESKPVQDYEFGISNKEIVSRALALLEKSGTITYDDVTSFVGEIFGWD